MVLHPAFDSNQGHDLADLSMADDLEGFACPAGLGSSSTSANGHGEDVRRGGIVIRGGEC
jgi:hypothetical protein